MKRNRQSAAQIAGKLAFDRVFRHGKQFTIGPVSAKVAPDVGPRLGLAVSKRYGNAVERNRFKRRVRSAFYAQLTVLPPLAVVVSPIRGGSKVGYAAIAQFVEALVRYDR